MNILHAFQYESSGVTWCEPEYQYSPYIAEFYNTISSVPYIILSLTQIWIYSPYTRRMDRRLKYMVFILTLTGIGSVCFHGTLSTVGQLLDELSILWMSAFCCAWYYPVQIFPGGEIKPREELRIPIASIAISCAIISTVLCRIYPTANAVALFVIGQPWLLALIMSYRVGEKTKLLAQVFWPTMILCALGFACWIIDVTFCNTTRALGLPIFHALWHILTAYGASYLVNLVLYHSCARFSRAGCPEGTLKQLHYPECMGILGVPYLVFDYSTFEKV